MSRIELPDVTKYVEDGQPVLFGDEHFMRAALRESEERTIALFNALQKMHATMNEQLGEQRRQMRTVQELLQLKQAEMTGEYIRENYDVDAVYCSDLPRAFQTAEHIAKVFPSAPFCFF